jgi:beta-glucosidase
MAYEYVKGLQSLNVSAMVKHFVRRIPDDTTLFISFTDWECNQAGFGTPEQGINTAPVHGGEREMRTTYLPPFKRAIIDAGAFSIMSAYHSYDGIPAVAHKQLLTDILRGEWGFKYYVG